MKPTPAQARMLRAMSEPKCSVHVSFDRRDPTQVTYVDGHPRLNGKWRWSALTFQALMRNGWVEPEPDPGEYWTNYKISTLGELILLDLTEDDFISIPGEKPLFSAKEIVVFLQKQYSQPEWAFFAELRAGTGGFSGRVDYDPSQRIDGWCMNMWQSKRFEKIAMEIKVYRSDYLKEIADPGKRAFAMRMSNRFYFVAPKNLIKREELPEHCGLMTVDEEGFLRTVHKPAWRDSIEPSWQFLASVLRSACKVREAHD